MKKGFYYLSLLAAAATLNACSSNDDVVAGDTTNEGGVEGTAYMNVSISLPTSSDTRAASFDKYDDGDASEYTVTDAKFLFYDEDGNYLTEGKTLTGDFDKETSTDNISRQKSATVVLGPTTIKPNTNVYMLTLLNYDQDIAQLKKAKDDVLAVTTSSVPAPSETNKTSFEMSTSAYVDGSDVVWATKVPAEKFYKSATDAEADSKAEANKVTVYVERTVAKVTMGVTSSHASTLADAAYNKPYYSADDDAYIFKLDKDDSKGVSGKINLYNSTTAGKDGYTTVYLKVLNLKANAINESGYLVKHIQNQKYSYITDATKESASNNVSDWTVDTWNKKDDFRSFWAEDANYTKGSTSGTDGTYTNLKWYAFTDVSTAAFDEDASLVDYVYENTVDQQYAKHLGGENANVTTMLIAGQVGEVGTDGNFAPLDMYRDIQTGIYYKSDNVNAMLLARLKNKGLKIKEGTNEARDIVIGDFTSNITPTIGTYDEDTDTEREKLCGSKITFTVASGVTVYDNNTDVTDNLKNGTGDYFTDIEHFNNGYCYYQVPIEHPILQSETTEDTKNNLYGVVRNHAYKLTLNTVGKIGAPVNDVEDPLEPIPGEGDYYYVGATINVLAWRSVSEQGVDL